MEMIIIYPHFEGFKAILLSIRVRVVQNRYMKTRTLGLLLLELMALKIQFA